jgi:hypothetical protein
MKGRGESILAFSDMLVTMRRLWSAAVAVHERDLMSRFVHVSLGVILALGCSALPALVRGQPAGKDALRTLSYKQLGDHVRSHKGKVIVVYFWSFG